MLTKNHENLVKLIKRSNYFTNLNVGLKGLIGRFIPFKEVFKPFKMFLRGEGLEVFDCFFFIDFPYVYLVKTSQNTPKYPPTTPNTPKDGLAVKAILFKSRPEPS